MSLWEDYDFDEYYDEAREVTCKYCGCKGLYWEEKNNRFILVNNVDEPHQCKDIFQFRAPTFK